MEYLQEKIQGKIQTIKQADDGTRLDYFNARYTTCTTLGPRVREQSTNACQNKSSETRTAHPDEHKHSGQTHQQILGRDASM